MIRLHKTLALCVAMAGCAPTAMHRDGGMTRQVQVKNRVGVPNAPELKRLKNGHYVVRKPWTVTLNHQDWHVQKGYQSNGMTSPSGITKMLGDGVEHPETWAAVFHDWLFTQPGITRSDADRMFREILLAYGVSPGKAELMYTTVSAYSLAKRLR